MLEFIHCSDIHVGLKNHGVVDPSTQQNSRVKDILFSFDRMIDHAHANGIKHVFIAGDVFHSKTPAISEQVEFIGRLRKLTEHNTKVYILLGNHDVSSISTRYCVLHALQASGMQNVHVFRDLGAHRCAEFDALFIGPYCAEERVPEIVQDFVSTSRNENKLAFCHPLVEGAEYSSGIEAETTEKAWNPSVFQHFKDFKYVGLGHVHKHQVISQKPRVVYSGSLSRCDFSEQEEKGFMRVKIVDGKTGTRFIPVDCREFVTYKGTQDELLTKRIDCTQQIVRLSITLTEGELLKRAELSECFFNAHSLVFDVTREKTVIKSSTHYTKKLDALEALNLYLEQDPEKQELIELYKEIVE